MTTNMQPEVLDKLREQFESNKTESMCMRYSDYDDDDLGWGDELNEDSGKYLDPFIQSAWECFIESQGYQVKIN